MESEKPLVTVITGYYNRKEGLRESIQSVLNQTYKNIEFIVFDDKSSDGTYELLSEFNDPRLKLIRHEQNIGFTAGMVKAAEMATGKYISVHGAGDISLPERIEKQLDILENKSDVAVVGCLYDNYNIVSGVNEEVRMKANFSRDDVFIKTPISQGGSMYRTEQYREVGGYNPIFKFVQDGELWLKLTCLGSIYVVQELLYKRIVFADGVSFNTRKTIQQSKFSLLARYIHKLSTEERYEVLMKCSIEGIDSVISYNNPSIQKKLFRKFHAVLDVQKTEDLMEFVKYSEGFYNKYYRFMIHGYRFALFRKFWHFAHFTVYKGLKNKIKA